MDESIVGLIEPADNFISNRDAVRQKVLFACFLLSAAFVIFFPGPGRIVKYIALPILLLLLYREPIFDYLIFPLSFLDNGIGTMLFGKVTLVWFFLLLLLIRFLVNGQFRFKRGPFLVLCLCTVYFLYGVGEYRMQAFKMTLVVLCTILVANTHEDDPEKMNLMLFAIWTSALLEALTLSLGLTGTLSETDRTTGVGFSDPNYASSICLYGFCVLMNLDTKHLWSRVLCVLGSLVMALGIFRSGSRSGFLVLLGVVLIHVFLLNNARKKLRYLLLLLLVVVLVLMVVNSGVLRSAKMDALMDRWFSMFDAVQENDLDVATTDRSAVLRYYWNYYSHQNILGILFGGNIPGSEAMLLAGHGRVTHNVYMDYLLAFGLTFSMILFFIHFQRVVRYFQAYRETGLKTSLAVTELKIAAFLMAMTLAMLRVNMWWFIMLI